MSARGLGAGCSLLRHVFRRLLHGARTACHRPHRRGLTHAASAPQTANSLANGQPTVDNYRTVRAPAASEAASYASQPGCVPCLLTRTRAWQCLWNAPLNGRSIMASFADSLSPYRIVVAGALVALLFAAVLGPCLAGAWSRLRSCLSARRKLAPQHPAAPAAPSEPSGSPQAAGLPLRVIQVRTPPPRRRCALPLSARDARPQNVYDCLPCAGPPASEPRAARRPAALEMTPSAPRGEPDEPEGPSAQPGQPEAQGQAVPSSLAGTSSAADIGLRERRAPFEADASGPPQLYAPAVSGLLGTDPQ
jgi:hypothetical protein